jgi:hypothetical protein
MDFHSGYRLPADILKKLSKNKKILSKIERTFLK